jgi:hypothetical protein
MALVVPWIPERISFRGRLQNQSRPLPSKRENQSVSMLIVGPPQLVDQEPRSRPGEE